MAKLEEKVQKSNNKKGKAKKRKHTSTENDDEIASKSLIIESEKTPEDDTQQKTQEKTKKSLKRKNKTAGNKTKQKRAKPSEDTDEDDEGNEPGDDDKDGQQLHEPTMEELRESEKPENNNAILTIRQKKKQKHKERLESQKGKSADKEKIRNVEYLQKWKNSKTEWKFEKLRQISIQQTMFDEDKMDANIWPIALEYLSKSKGATQEKINKLAEEVIDKIDEECSKLDDDARQALIESVRYQRARELLQSFD